MTVSAAALSRCDHSQEPLQTFHPLKDSKGKGQGKALEGAELICPEREREGWLVQEEQKMTKRDLSAVREGG